MILLSYVIGLVCGALSQLMPRITGTIVALLPLVGWGAYVLASGPALSDDLLGWTLVGCVMGGIAGGVLVSCAKSLVDRWRRRSAR